MNFSRLFAHWKFDLPASLVVFVVAVPLSLGIALASGTSPASGLIAAAIGGIVVGLFGGAPLMVSGPAAGLTVLVYQIVQQIGITGLAIATLLAGGIQVLMSLVRAGWIFRLFPSSILNGMLAAIGLIILLGQLHVLFGQSVPESPLLALSQLPNSVLAAFASGVGAVVWISGLSIALLFFWPKLSKAMKEKLPFMQQIPAALPAVVIVTLVSLPLDLERIHVESLFASMGNSLRSIAGSSALDWNNILLFSLGIAIVASAESLLTARATQLLEKNRNESLGLPYRDRLDLDRELLAQGLGNAASGALGGLPITGVIVRSAANIDSGGRSQLSAVLHGLWVLAFVLLLPFVMNQIPMAALAAVLVMTGIKLLNIKQGIQNFRESFKEGFLWAFTLAAIVMTNLLAGLTLALALVSILESKKIIHWFLNRFSRKEESRRDHQASEESKKDLANDYSESADVA